MNQKEYLEKFSRAVRWRTSVDEAEDIISDYEDMLDQSAPDEPVEQRWGNPYETARLLSEPKAYRTWLTVFGILSGCLLLHAVWIMRPWSFHISNVLTFGCLLVGILLSLFCFRPNQSGDCPKGLRWSLIGISVLILFVMIGSIAAFGVLTFVLIPQAVGRFIGFLFRALGAIGTAASVWGLFQARTKDYRWRALYVLGLTSTIVCRAVVRVWTGLDASWPFVLGQWFIIELMLWCSYAGIGAVGTVLCLKKR